MSKATVNFHVDNNDYFGTLAAVISLLGQNLGDYRQNLTYEHILQNIVKDLMYLQRNYKIEKRKQKNGNLVNIC